MADRRSHDTFAMSTAVSIDRFRSDCVNDVVLFIFRIRRFQPTSEAMDVV